MTIVNLEKERIASRGDEMNPVDVLRDTAFKIEDGRIKAKGVMVITLLEGEDDYLNLAWASLRASDRIAMCEVAKAQAIEELME